MLYSFLVFVDYKNAFDAVLYKILLAKLDYYGIRRPALNLISSYLNCRTQLVSISGSFFFPKKINYDAP